MSCLDCFELPPAPPAHRRPTRTWTPTPVRCALPKAKLHNRSHGKMCFQNIFQISKKVNGNVRYGSMDLYLSEKLWVYGLRSSEKKSYPRLQESWRRSKVKSPKSQKSSQQGNTNRESLDTTSPNPRTRRTTQRLGDRGVSRGPGCTPCSRGGAALPGVFIVTSDRLLVFFRLLCEREWVGGFGIITSSVNQPGP